MRIVHVVLSLDIGGQERLLLNLSRVLIRRGHDVSVISLTKGGSLRSEFDGIPIFDVSKQAGFDRHLFLQLAQTFRQIKPDVVHTHNPPPLIYAAPSARLARVRRVVHTKHGVNSFSGPALYMQRASLLALNAYVAVSANTAEVAREKERVPARLLRIIDNGIPLDRFRPDEAVRKRLRDSLGIPEQAFVVGTVGRLVKEKNYPLLVRSMAPLLGENCRLVLVGDGAKRDEIKQAIPASLAPFVAMTGPRHDVADLLTSFDVFALTSITEGLPLAIPEAMASGLPIVATKVGSIPTIVPKDAGIVVESGDEQGLTAAFSSFKMDRERTKKMGDAARSYALGRFSLETMTDAYVELYKGNRG